MDQDLANRIEEEIEACQFAERIASENKDWQEAYRVHTVLVTLQWVMGL